MREITIFILFCSYFLQVNSAEERYRSQNPEYKYFSILGGSIFVGLPQNNFDIADRTLQTFNKSCKNKNLNDIIAAVQNIDRVRSYLSYIFKWITNHPLFDDERLAKKGWQSVFGQNFTSDQMSDFRMTFEAVFSKKISQKAFSYALNNRKTISIVIEK